MHVSYVLLRRLIVKMQSTKQIYHDIIDDLRACNVYSYNFLHLKLKKKKKLFTFKVEFFYN